MRRTDESAPRRAAGSSSSSSSARPPSRTRRRTQRRLTWTRTTSSRTRPSRTKRGACGNWRGSKRTRRPATACSPSARSRRRFGACPRRRRRSTSTRTRSCDEGSGTRRTRGVRRTEARSPNWGSCRSTTTKARFSRKPRMTPSARRRRTRFTRETSPPPPAGPGRGQERAAEGDAGLGDKFGKVGQTKWTHLANEDTSRLATERPQHRKAGKEQSFEKPSRKI